MTSESAKKEDPPANRGIILKGASFRFAHAEILKDASLSVRRGGACVITGPSGSGKSTLLCICAGLLPLRRGILRIGGERPEPLRPSELLRRGVRIGFVFQEGGLLSNMNALANVALPLRYHMDVLGIGVADVERRSRAALDRVGLTEAQRYELPALLSLGVRKRVALARAIALDPNFFYFDDPDVGLDPATALLVHETLSGYRDDPEVTMVVATNRESLIDTLGVSSHLLSAGKLVPRLVAPPPPVLPHRIA